MLVAAACVLLALSAADAADFRCGPERFLRAVRFRAANVVSVESGKCAPVENCGGEELMCRWTYQCRTLWQRDNDMHTYVAGVRPSYDHPILTLVRCCRSVTKELSDCTWGKRIFNRVHEFDLDELIGDEKAIVRDLYIQKEGGFNALYMEVCTLSDFVGVPEGESCPGEENAQLVAAQEAAREEHEAAEAARKAAEQAEEDAFWAAQAEKDRMAQGLPPEEATEPPPTPSWFLGKDNNILYNHGEQPIASQTGDVPLKPITYVNGHAPADDAAEPPSRRRRLRTRQRARRIRQRQ